MRWYVGFLAIFLVSSTLVLETIKADNILIVAFFSSKSHKLTYLPLAKKMGELGHNVTLVTPIKAIKPMKNVKEVMTLDWDALEKEMHKKDPDAFDPYKAKETETARNPFTQLKWFVDLCRNTYDLPVIKELLKEKFDLIMIQPMFNDCALGFVHKLKAPLVLFTPLSAPGFILEKMGVHFPTSFSPNIFLSYPSEMTFLQRMTNFGYNVFLESVLRFYYEPAMTAIYREKLGDDIPDVRTILGNASLALSNGHFSLHGPKMLLPDVVEIGGIHSFSETKPLPKELEEFVSKGNNGFIFFSMGSAIKGSRMPEEKRQMFLRVFSKLKQQVVWKWETETMEGLPKNVKLSKWLPQEDLLAHKDIKMFITHCGGGSTEESIYHGVPLIGLPMFGDQSGNAKLAHKHGMIVELDWNKVTEESLTNAIQDILNKPEYRLNAKKISTIFQDQPNTPMDRGVYWLEYILRHKGAPHLRSASRKLNWFQYHSYDVILAYLGIIGSALYLIFSISRWIVLKLCCRSSTKSSKSKKD